MAVVRQRQNLVPFIIFMVLFVASTTGLVLVAIELSNARQQADRGFNPSQEPKVKSLVLSYTDKAGGLKLALLKADQEIGRLRKKIESFERVTGKLDPTKLEKEMDQLVERILKIQEGGGEESPAEAITLMGFIHLLEKEKILLAERLSDQKKAREEEKAELASRIRAEETKVSAKQITIDQRDVEIEKLRHTMSQDRATAQHEASGLRASLAEVRQQSKEEQDAMRERIKILETGLADARYQLRVIRKEKAFEAKGTRFEKEREPADGKVILVDRHTGVVVDIGRKQGVSRGLRFQVLTQKSDGTRITRGEFEAKTVFPEISRGILVGENNPVDIVHKGAIIINPAFDPGRAKIFVADTTFGAAEKQSFRDILSKYGSVLEDKLTIRTDYLIIGPREGKFVDRAEKIGGIIIREDELNAFLGR